MRSMATCSVRYSKSKVRGQKHPMEVVKIRNIIPNISYVFFQHTEIVPWLTVMMRYYVTFACSLTVESHNLNHGPLAKYVKLRVRMRREWRERFPRQITSPYSFHIFQWIFWLCILFHMNSGFLEPVQTKQLARSTVLHIRWSQLTYVYEIGVHYVYASPCLCVPACVNDIGHWSIYSRCELIQRLCWPD